MGFAKYAEDIQRDIDENNYVRVVFEPNFRSKTYYDCYYCDKSFNSKEARNRHIKKDHNVVGPLLFVNGKICNETEYIESITYVKIALCGFGETEIILNGETIVNDDIVDITDKVKETDVNPIIVKIGQRSFNIHFYKKARIENDDIDIIIKNWETRLSKNLTIEKQYPKNCNEAEKRYLDGFFNYYTACGAKAEYKKKRYEDAYSILSEFGVLTAKVQILLKVIAFRLNWVEKLELLCKTSKGEFDSVLAFFKNQQLEMAKTHEKDKKVEIFAEDEIIECIEAITAFRNKDWVSVDSYIDKFNDDSLFHMEDINLKDRILLLKARRMEMKKEFKLAKKYYLGIKTPFFCAEADVFVQKRIKRSL